jgi:hypothetical protein
LPGCCCTQQHPSRRCWCVLPGWDSTTTSASMPASYTTVNVPGGTALIMIAQRRQRTPRPCAKILKINPTATPCQMNWHLGPGEGCAAVGQPVLLPPHCCCCCCCAAAAAVMHSPAWPPACHYVCADAWRACSLPRQHVGVEVAMGHQHTRRCDNVVCVHRKSATASAAVALCPFASRPSQSVTG